MEKDALRRADFKTGLTLIAFSLWFLAITLAFMPFRETYAGVENVWYVSPWIFPSIVLTLLLVLSVILTVNAVLRGAYGDVIEVPDGRLARFRLTRLGSLMMMALALASAAGLVFLVINIEKKIAFTIEEAQWLADPSTAEIFSWWDPFAIIPLVATSLVLILSLAILVAAAKRGQAAGSVLNGDGQWYRDEAFIRFAVIVLLFVELVYLLIPRVDFFVAVLAFLSTFTVCFHLDRADIIRRWMVLYLAIGAGVLLAFPTGLAGMVNGAIPHLTDVLILLAVVALMVVQWRETAADAAMRADYRTCLIIAWVTPSILTPVFRFGLLVPLPHEGAVVMFLHEVRYLLRQAGVLDLLSTGL